MDGYICIIYKKYKLKIILYISFKKLEEYIAKGLNYFEINFTKNFSWC